MHDSVGEASPGHDDEGRVVPRHAASLIVLRRGEDGPEVLMGVRGAGHRFMPNVLVFPGGAVDEADGEAAIGRALRNDTRAHLGKAADDRLVHALAVAAARELEEETGLSLGSPAELHGLFFLCRMVTPVPSPVRFNARFLVVDADFVSGRLGGSGELEQLRYVGPEEALEMQVALPTRQVLGHLRRFLAMSPAEREGRATTPVFVGKTWGIE